MMATSLANPADDSSTGEGRDCNSPIGGIGMDHLTVVPENFEQE